MDKNKKLSPVDWPMIFFMVVMIVLSTGLAIVMKNKIVLLAAFTPSVFIIFVTTFYLINRKKSKR